MDHFLWNFPPTVCRHLKIYNPHNKQNVHPIFFKLTYPNISSNPNFSSFRLLLYQSMCKNLIYDTKLSVTFFTKNLKFNTGNIYIRFRWYVKMDKIGLPTHKSKKFAVFSIKCYITVNICWSFKNLSLWIHQQINTTIIGPKSFKNYSQRKNNKINKLKTNK